MVPLECNKYSRLPVLSQPSDILQLSFTAHRGPLAASSCFTSWLLPCLLMIALCRVRRGLCVVCQGHGPMFPCLPSCRSCSLDSFPDAQKKRQVNMRTINLYSIIQHDRLTQRQMIFTDVRVQITLFEPWAAFYLMFHVSTRKSKFSVNDNIMLILFHNVWDSSFDVCYARWPQHVKFI